MSTPNERLAELVARALAADGLIPGAREDETRVKLATGGMKEQDWRVLIELGADAVTEASDGRTPATN